MSTEVVSKSQSEGALYRPEDEEEDGEIVDADDNGFIPLSGERINVQDCLSDDDEPPDEILNRVAKKKAEESGLIQEALDPKLCVICQKTPHRYRCPKCDTRTCSVSCSQKHKELENCDGVRPPFQPVAKLSQFDAEKSVQDQRFLHAVQSNLKGGAPSAKTCSASEERRKNGPDENDRENASDGLRHKANSTQERYLIQNALRRRIWLSFSDDKGGEDCSRHEQFSDTIFWCIDLVFTKELDDGTASEYSYRVQNIPETIRLVTVLRQFLKPRQHGCIVSKSDLDLEKLAPFIEAGVENINGFMLVPNYEPQRYYAIDFEKSVLHNTRNRVLVNHPRIIITLNNEFMLAHELVSEFEAEEIREKQRQLRVLGQATEECNVNGFHRGRGMRGGRGGFRGGWERARRGDRGGPKGRFSDRFDRKRRRDCDENERVSYGKRGGGGECDQGRAPNYRSLDDEFDPFEPFEGPVRLPRSYLGNKDASICENGTDSSGSSSSRRTQGTQENEAIKCWEKCIAEKEHS